MGRLGEETQVLHVDDYKKHVRLTEVALREVEETLEILCETTVEDGLAVFRDSETDVDCIVSDYVMPQKDGLDFLAAVRDDDQKFPFILFTGQGSEEIASTAISAGVTDYLQKGHGMGTFQVLANRITNAVTRYRTEKEIKQVYEAMEAAQDGISLLNDEGQFTYVNQAYATLYGYEPDELLGEHWSLIYPDEEVIHVKENILNAINEGEKWHGETTGLRKDGSTFREDHILVHRDDGGLICSVSKISGSSS
ncbi:PAS domain S-box protein [Natrinema sp. 1APR25-10V2]|uniref:PAS domain-containing response regulator n=1 Tax=Natrinema sp. 1APR25-10V2 TaxID=2951081 RepID=UPI002876B309|nr:PAS domain S-box protein [Natrinema sp. 1APR25-10V2]MDS0476857.1 PAS domain S-box protein [Natrinema sp. 1APR25-10V2]